MAVNSPSIVGLFLGGGPTAVPGRVPLGVVDPIQGRTEWTLTHVGKEVRVGLPPLAYGDATAAVSGVVGHRWVFAPGFGGAPGHQCGGHFVPAVPAVCGDLGGNALALLAPTTAGAPIANPWALRADRVSTVADAIPVSASACDFVGALEYGQKVEPLAGEINEFAHAAL
jgi:hypothetical protein